MEVVDRDGDRLEFRVDAKGRLCEFVNGKLEIARIEFLKYSLAAGRVEDKTGHFQIKEEEQTEKALGLRALAARTGVAWLGDEPAPATELVLTDTDGDRLEFSLTDAGKLQELSNGELELAEVRTLEFSFADGTVRDDSGVFALPASECMQKVAVLRSLAQQAGVVWSGDEPGEPPAASGAGSEPPGLDIENCGTDWEFKCPKRWEQLRTTARPDERFCETCKETVYFCRTEEQLQEHTHQRRCVAFDLREPAAASAVEEDVAALLDVRVVCLSGQELPPVRLPATAPVHRLKAALAKAAGIPAAEQRLLLAERELQDARPLGEEGVTGEAVLQLLRVPRPKVPHPPARRMMGKRAPPGRRG